VKARRKARPCATPKKNKEPRKQFTVGDQVKVKLHTGEVVDAIVRVVLEEVSDIKLQVDYGHDETALVKASQVVD
jgi:molybdopterin-binding protein